MTWKAQKGPLETTEWHWNFKPFKIQTSFDHSKFERFLYSSPHCIYLMGFFLQDSFDCSADDSDSDVDNDENDDVDIGSRRSIIGSFHRLKTWFENQYQTGVCKSVSPKKKAKLEGVGEEEEMRPPLLIVIEDFEAFAPKVLQNFILNIRYNFCFSHRLGQDSPSLKLFYLRLWLSLFQ